MPISDWSSDVCSSDLRTGRLRMTTVEPATAADAEALSAFAEASFVDTFGHIYDPADLAAFLAGWNPPERIAAQIADPDWTVALVRGAGRSGERPLGKE